MDAALLWRLLESAHRSVQMNFRERKEQRRLHYEKYVKGWKLVTCTACNGSGYYDNYNSPRCGCCGGSGKERRPPSIQIPKMDRSR